MKVVSVVGLKKTGKTTLVAALVKSLKRYGRVGTVKHMPGHAVHSGDTRRHLEAGADVVFGIGEGVIRVRREGTLASALDELSREGMDFVVVEGFKGSGLPKIVLGDLDVDNVVKRLTISELDGSVLKEITEIVLSQEEFEPGPDI